ncbi:sensor histidine kinase [Sphaerisporangium sp. NPDC049003]|uniref:sensor histidine kinase n=1 Tax=Sphaerisporangium sp. NPDC049003 TaxID=3364517 RepID=UPI0037239D77
MPRLRPSSIRARYTIATAVLSLVAFTLIGLGLDYTIRLRTQAITFLETQRVATDWIAAMQPGNTRPTPTNEVNLLQLVDSQGRVVQASAPLAGSPPLSSDQPSVDDRIQDRVECSTRHGCVLVTAIRVPPQVARQLWGGEPHFVYAGTREPLSLAEHHLELYAGAGALLATAFAAWTTWMVVGRTLRPIKAIREKTSEITVTDLSQRVPQPPGRDEIAQLARASNQNLAQLETAVDQLRHFASLVTHELRSPISGLRAQLEEALLYPGEMDPRSTIQTALSTTERCQAIINEVLMYAHIQTAVPAPHEPVDLGALVRQEVATRIRGVPVRARVDHDVKVMGNPLHLTGLLSNLLVNAQRHAATRVEVTVGGSGGQAVVTVTDDGDGIAPEDRERVFEPFTRLKDARRRDPKGSGLGLALCREVAGAHHGTLLIEDSPKGARFVLRLPAVDQP